MTKFIELNRKFHDLTEQELAEPEILAQNEHKYSSLTGWTELLESDRVLLLAEAGSGKTLEMREQAARLALEGHCAYFTELTSLAVNCFTDLLSASDEKSFGNWKNHRSSPAWFFLDAVDELKLTNGKFELALKRLAKALDDNFHQVRVIISCRPNDWRPLLDKSSVQSGLPISRKPMQVRSLPPEELFLLPLREHRNKSGKTAPQETDARKKDQEFRTVILLPMNSQQIELFAESSGLPHPQAFLQEIENQNAWTFARRPLDLMELIGIWKSDGKLGTRAEQHEANVIAKLRDNPERPDNNTLSDEKAREGAERLALALTLTRNRTLRSHEQSLSGDRAEGVLNPATILTDWNPAERHALLRRALFDPATYGRIRFHHRSVQEYLAAGRLAAIASKGMPKPTLLRFFFAERYGEKVVIPSLRPVAAWMALYSEDVGRELTLREPEVLLSEGDPESLTVPARIELLRSFVSKYGTGGWRGLRISGDDARRLAHPDLAPVIRELWGSEPANEDVRELLINLIWYGRIEACCDQVLPAALNTSWRESHRIWAVRALIDCHKTESVVRVVQHILTQSNAWSAKMVCQLAPKLFPDFMTTDDLMLLMERTPEPADSLSGFKWNFFKIAENLRNSTKLATELRNRVADLIWRTRSADLTYYHIWGDFSYLAKGLSLLCSYQLAITSASVDSDLIYASVVALRFGRRDHLQDEEIDLLRLEIQKRENLRAPVFWAELDFMDAAVPEETNRDRFWNVNDNNLIGSISAADWPWLEAALKAESPSKRRPVALLHLLSLRCMRGQMEEDLTAIRDAVQDNPELLSLLEKETTSPEPNPAILESQRKAAKLKAEHEARETSRVGKWGVWREEVSRDPEKAFLPDKALCTIQNLYTWLSALHRNRSKNDVWDPDAVAGAFGADVAEKAEEALKALWRTIAPAQWSTRSEESRSGTPYVWLAGLCGLSAESRSAEWAFRLTPDEARNATAYATIEINSLASFIGDLVDAHPAVVKEVLGNELEEQFKLGGSCGYLPLLQNLTQADLNLKRLLTPRLISSLVGFPNNIPAESVPHWRHTLEESFSILEQSATDFEREALGEECLRRYNAGAANLLKLQWLRGLFRFDQERASNALLEALTSAVSPDVKSELLVEFTSLFGGRKNSLLKNTGLSISVSTLASLVRMAFSCVRCEDDQTHDGVYTPDERDNAETARNLLLSVLLDEAGPEAYEEILKLATGPALKHFPDRLRLMARKRAATDSEFTAYGPKDINLLESRYELPPHDRASLFRVMLDRLEDISYDVAHHDLTDRATLRTITNESEMQRVIALKMENKANKSYSVVREDEVADGKKTDIRLLTNGGGHKAVIEIKLADGRWSIADFERALNHQLVGQYLRHGTCKAGCLLLTYNGTKSYWQHPESKKRMNFQALIIYLNEKAEILEASLGYSILLKVVGLDLTDPVLVPAHKRK